jgi:hypothetical protein
LLKFKKKVKRFKKGKKVRIIERKDLGELLIRFKDIIDVQ